MIKRFFVFSDMQFDEANANGTRKKIGGGWATNYDVIETAYKKKAGYEVPQIVYWDLLLRERRRWKIRERRALR